MFSFIQTHKAAIIPLITLLSGLGALAADQTFTNLLASALSANDVHLIVRILGSVAVIAGFVRGYLAPSPTQQ
jgi:uncharacterized protein YjeT (DUF2065 family)